MPHLVHHKRLRIEWGHCDPAGIVFNSRFFEYFDWSTWEMFESVLGVPRQDLFTTYDIIGVPLVDAQAQLVLLADDALHAGNAPMAANRLRMMPYRA